MWLTLCTALVGYVPDGRFKQQLNRFVSIMCFGVLSGALSAVITYHNQENQPKTGICVANHTSPIDVLILMCDNCYSLVGLGFNVICCIWVHVVGLEYKYSMSKFLFFSIRSCKLLTYSYNNAFMKKTIFVQIYVKLIPQWFCRLKTNCLIKGH